MGAVKALSYREVDKEYTLAASTKKYKTGYLRKKRREEGFKKKLQDRVGNRLIREVRRLRHIWKTKQ